MHIINWVVFAYLSVLAAAQTAGNTSVTSLDPRLVYTGKWVVQDGGGHEFTGDTAASVSLIFEGG
jgi:hypothetical protein